MTRDPLGRTAGLIIAAATLVAACSSGGTSTPAAGSPDATAPASTTPASSAPGASAPDSSPAGAVPGPLEDAVTIHFGVFPNVTHAPGLVLTADGGPLRKLLPNATIDVQSFSSGTKAIESVASEATDITYIGPNPAINAHAQSNGEAIRIVAGSTSGGAYLVVKPDITSPEQLAGTTLATPSLGNTQDVALRAWLKDQGFETSPDGGGDVTILPQKNSTTLESFISGDIDGAWVPEPWATRLVEEGGGTVLVDERDLWTDTDGQYVTTHLIARTQFLEEHPDLVKAVIEGLADAIDLIEADPAAAQADVVSQISSITGTDPNADTIATSFGNLTFTLDPVAASLQGSADDAIAVGLLDPVDLTGIYDLTLLNEVLEARGQPAVEGL